MQLVCASANPDKVAEIKAVLAPLGIEILPRPLEIAEVIEDAPTLEGNARLKVDFEIGDALAKLERLRIVARTGESYRAQPLAKALEMLDWTWDNYFKYNNPQPEQPPVP